MLIRKSGIAHVASVQTSSRGFRLTVSFGVRAEIGGCGGRFFLRTCLLSVLALLAIYVHECGKAHTMRVLLREQDFKLLVGEAAFESCNSYQRCKSRVCRPFELGIAVVMRRVVEMS